MTVWPDRSSWSYRWKTQSLEVSTEPQTKLSTKTTGKETYTLRGRLRLNCWHDRPSDIFITIIMNLYIIKCTSQKAAKYECYRRGKIGSDIATSLALSFRVHLVKCDTHNSHRDEQHQVHKSTHTGPQPRKQQ